MTKQEQKSLEVLSVKLDDLSNRFDRFISACKYFLTTLFLGLTAIATFLLVIKK